MKRWMVFFGLAWLSVLLTACGPTDAPVLTRLEWERGHGSAWGNQLYIAITGEEIAEARYSAADSSELETVRHIPITGQQWEELTERVQKLELKNERPAWLEKIFASSRLDGGEYRTLTLFWQTEKGTREVRYQWPRGADADELEALLETLIKTANLEE